jgi:hypothetical protein
MGTRVEQAATATVAVRPVAAAAPSAVAAAAGEIQVPRGAWARAALVSDE